MSRSFPFVPEKRTLKENPMKSFTVAAALLAAVLPSATTVARAATQTFEGTVSDSMCEKKHMMPGKTDADCIKACVKSGSAYVLVTGNKVYSLSGKPAGLAQFAGRHVTVQGLLNQGTITVSAIH
jgi:hypothetical protein